MSDQPPGSYHFVAWARRGIAATLNPGSGPPPSRASVSVQLSLDAQKDGTNIPQNPLQVSAEMFGPGDAIGIDSRCIVRTEPPDSTLTFEPSYFCHIEFDAPDFPWALTPVAPNGDQLGPWLVLIALKPEEFKLPSAAVVEVQTIEALPDLSQSWNWAHTQVTGDTPLADTLASARENVISRLLCPRSLEPETSYTAFLVPAFEIRQDASGMERAYPAWTSQTPVPFQLPFYYQFKFHTSDGNFESLVRRLTPRPLPAGVGLWLMDVSQPARTIPSAGAPLGLEGALHSRDAQSTDWNKDKKNKDKFQKKVQDWINQPAAITDDPANPHPEDPKIVPPIYGRWHAAVQRVDREAKGWVHELNLDPRNRSAAGIGTQVVQQERTQLIHSAWQQVEGVLKANQLIKQAQLARATLQQIYRQHLQRATPATLMSLTAPLHARLLASPTTIRAAVRASRVPERMFSGAFRKSTRPWRRLGGSPAKRPSLLRRINTGQVTVVPPPKPPDGLVSIEQVSDERARSLVKRLLELLVAIERAYHHSHGGSRRLFLFLLLGVAAVAVAAALLPAAVLSELEEILGVSKVYKRLRMSGFTPETVTEVPGRPGFKVTPPGTPPGAGGGGGPDSAEAKAFRSATQELFTAFQTFPVDPRPKPSLDLEKLKNTLLSHLDPTVTVPRRVQALISISPRISWQPADLLADPIMAAPEFPKPMYLPLRDLSPQYILPGVDLIPPDTLGLLVSNQKFIEPYLMGANYEMGRQLLWEGYPCDQRGTYFRYFWDVSACVPQPGAPDIPPIHTWPRNVPLGEHPGRTDVVANNVVLLVRGELFKRHPHAIVYAGKAKLDADGKPVLDEADERYPIYRGTLRPDMTFLGFNLSLDDARGGTSASPEGFFLVFQEEPSGVRFGLNPDDPNSQWGANSAQSASNLLRNPYRILIHADLMLPSGLESSSATS